MTDNRLPFALGYAGRGWPVFVLSPTKTPVKNCDRCHDEHTTPERMEACGCLCCHGFYSASTDEGRIRAMLNRHPRGLLAIRTGAPSGTVVVDVDQPDGPRTLAMLDEAGLLPGTLLQETGRGGAHLVYAHPGVRIASGVKRLGPGIDVKADGGYIVAAPSVHPKTGNPYRWSGDGRYDHPLAKLHPKIVERLGPQPERPRATVSQLSRNAGSTHGRLRALVEKVLAAPRGEGNAILHWSACRGAEMVAAGEIDEHTIAEALLMAAVERGRPESEARRTIASGMRTGRGAA